MIGRRPLSILMLAPLPPWPVNNGSKVRMFHLARALAARHRVTLFSLRCPLEAKASVEQQLPSVDLQGVDGPPQRSGPISILRSVRRREPIHVVRVLERALAAYAEST